jgi:triosephosphate isomerase (TIM)
MRKQIAAANWKMNGTFQQGEKLLDDILNAEIELSDNQLTIFAVPYPYLLMTRSEVEEEKNYYAAAQNCHDKKSGAFTGEISAEMLHSMNINYCVVGHSERREYNGETNAMLAEKINRCIENFVTPIFCCGEPLEIREAGTQNDFVAKQLKESLFHLPASTIKNIIIAYEPIWAIGTGKTASTAQAQEIHHFLRSVIATQYDESVADEIPILYGGSVKANNAKELFSCPDVDGGLVGGSSLVAVDFIEIIKALKQG